MTARDGDRPDNRPRVSRAAHRIDWGAETGVGCPTAVGNSPEGKLPKNGCSRREFGRIAVGASVALAGPLVLPARLFGAGAPSNRIRVGQIGCGRIARGHDMPAVLDSGLADIVAVCDVDSKRAGEGKARVEKLYRDAKLHAARGRRLRRLPRAARAARHRRRRDQHARPLARRAGASPPSLAGKDIYLQKPFTMTHAEGVLLRDAVAKKRRVLQIGSQQRSIERSSAGRASWSAAAASAGCSGSRSACRSIRRSRTIPSSRCRRISTTTSGSAPRPQVYYTEQRVHPQGRLRPARLAAQRGLLPRHDHRLGLAPLRHRALGAWTSSSAGPAASKGKAEFPTNRIWNVHGAYHIELVYPGDVRVRVSDSCRTASSSSVTRAGSSSRATAPDDRERPGEPRARNAASRRQRPEAARPGRREGGAATKRGAPQELARERAARAERRSRPAPVAHGSNTACIVGWIAMKLGRPLTWDAKQERFVGDEQANAMLSRPERAPYGASREVKA